MVSGPTFRSLIHFDFMFAYNVRKYSNFILLYIYIYIYICSTCPASLIKKTCLFFICFCSVAQSYLNLCDPMNFSMPDFPVHHYLPESQLRLMTIESVMPSSHLILCHPLLLLPSTLPRIRAFSIELAVCIRWLKYWSFSINISPFNEYSDFL